MKKKKIRYAYLDMMKSIAIILMVLLETFDMMKYFGFLGNSFPILKMTKVMGIFYLFTPTVFMLCMGCCLAKQKQVKEKETAIRGAELFFIGLLLNIARALMFTIIGAYHNKTILYNEALTSIWSSNILIFAGLFLLFYSLLKVIKLNDWIIFAITFAMVVGAHFIPTIKSESIILKSVLGNFIYVNDDSRFYFMAWAIFPMCGVIFQKLYISQKDKMKFVVIFELASICVASFVFVFLIAKDILKIRYYMWGEYGFKMDLPSFAITVSVGGVFLAVVWLVSCYAQNTKFANLLKWFTSNVTGIYICQTLILLLIALQFDLLGTLAINSVFVFVLFVIGILALSTYLSWITKKLIKVIKERKQIKKI